MRSHLAPLFALLTIAAAPSHAAEASAPQAGQPKPVHAQPIYRAYKDEAPGDWRQLNDTVGRIGGWRAYAKESYETRSRDTRKPAGAAQ